MWPRFAALSQLGFELFGSAEVEGAWRRPSQVLHKCLTTMLGPGAGCLWRHWSPVVFSCLNHCFGTFVTDVQTCDDVRVQSATKLTASVLGGGGDDNVPCTYTHVGCYATHGWAGGGDVIKWRNLGQSGCSTAFLWHVNSIFLFGGRAQRCFALQDTPKSPQDCLPSTIAFHTFAPLQCRLWHVLIYFMAWASMLPRPLVRGPPLQPCLFLCFLAVVLRFGFSCSGFLPGFFKKGAKKVSVADDRLDYYMVRADPASPGTIPCPRRSRSMPALLE